MAKPDFQILSDTELYSNSLTPLQVSAIPSNEYSSNYFIWDFGDGNKSTGKSAEHVYETIGDFDITLTQYLPSGEPVVSDSKTVTVRNLIPNLMEWDSDSYDAGSITASVKNTTPFIANVWNSWQQYDENSFLHLYVENSKSIPFDITDKRIHLKPNWRFVDKDDNVVETITLKQDKIYAYKLNDKILFSTNESDGDVFVGISSQAEFFFIDDTPSGIDPDEDYLPSTIIVTQNLSGIYGDDKFTKEDYLQYPSLINSVFVDNIVPEKLSITTNGVFDFDGIKYIDTRIPYNIRLIDNNGNFIKTSPFESDSVNPYIMDIGFIGENISTSPETSFVGNSLQRFKADFSKLGGFFESHFLPLQSTTDYISLSASTDLDYIINKTLTRYGIFSDENSNKIYRTSYVEGFNKTYTRKDSEVIGNQFDGFTSNKFGALVDTNYNAVFLDSDDSRIEIYDTVFDLISSIDLSGYDDFILSSVQTYTIPISSQTPKYSSVGDSILGESSGDSLGLSIAFDGDGNRLIVGSDAGSSGEAKVYTSEYVNNSWVQLGQTLSSLNNSFAETVDINYDGNIIAIGSYRSYVGAYANIYQLSSNSWVPLGSTITNAGEVRLNSSGDRLIVGYIGGGVSNAGEIRSYQLVAGSWVQVGGTITGDNAGDNLGWSVDINSTGDIIAAGAPNNDDFASSAGQVKVYQLSAGSWVQLGQTLLGDNAYDDFGRRIKLNSAGDKLFVSSPYNDDFASSAGQVKTYQLSAGSWVHYGTITGDGETGRMGEFGLDVDDDGDTLIVGSHLYDEFATNGGIASVYKYYDSDWNLWGDVLSGGANDQLGYGVAITPNGGSIAVSAPFDDTIDFNTGKIDVYDISADTLSSDTLTSFRGHSSPAQIQMDKEGNYFITLHETADLLYVIDNEVKKIDLYDQIAGGFLTLSGDAVVYEDNFGLSSYVYYDSDGGFLFQPAALDILSDNETIYVAYTNENYNFIQKYKLDKSTDPYGLSSLWTHGLSSDVPMDMVSTRGGDRLYILTTNYYSRESYITTYITETNTLSASNFVGYDAEFLTIDTSQNPWTIAKSTKDSESYNITPVENDQPIFKEYSLSSIYNGFPLSSTYGEGEHPVSSIDDPWRTDFLLSSNLSSSQIDINKWELWRFFSEGLLSTETAIGELWFSTWNTASIDFRLTFDLAGANGRCDVEFIVNGQLIDTVTHTLLAGGTFQDYTLNLTPDLNGNDILIRSSFGADSDIEPELNWSRVEVLGLSSVETVWGIDYSGVDFPITHVGGVTADSYDNIWVLDSNNDRMIVFNKDNPDDYEFITISDDKSISNNLYVAYGDWNGFRWYNKFGYGGEIITYYGLSGQSEPFKILPRGKYNLQKINEDFNATETLKSYRTTDLMLNYENLFDNFLGSIYGNNLDDGTYIGKNIYEKIANFVMNHGDIETCSIDALQSFCEETGVEFETRINFPRDIKRLIDLFSIKFKKLWGDDYKTGFIEDYRGDEINTLTYNVSADPQVKFIAKEKFNNFYTIIDPLLIDSLSSYSLSSYEQSWGWGLSIPANGDLQDYYEFYEMLPVDDQRWISVVDWENPLTDTTIEPISSYSDYMGENGIVSTILGDKLRDGLGLYL